MAMSVALKASLGALGVTLALVLTLLLVCCFRRIKGRPVGCAGSDEFNVFESMDPDWVSSRPSRDGATATITIMPLDPAGFDKFDALYLLHPNKGLGCRYDGPAMSVAFESMDPDWVPTGRPVRNGGPATITPGWPSGPAVQVNK